MRRCSGSNRKGRAMSMRSLMFAVLVLAGCPEDDPIH